MGESTNFILTILGAVILAVCVVCLAQGFSVSAEDIAGCVEKTGWSDARCRVEYVG